MTTAATDETAASLLGPQGPIARALAGFVPRPAQQRLAARIDAAFEQRGVFIAESGTGTGKTFAYLVPALRAGRKVLISTGTRHLQDRLFEHDIPLVKRALGSPALAAVLKGRANYLCLRRFEQAQAQSGSRETRVQLARVREWLRVTRRGDIGEIDTIPEDSPLSRELVSGADDCLGARCEYYDDCYVNRVRREALAADVVVVNHHLFFADLALREEGFGQLLPGVDAVVFDEAHQLPEVATQFFGASFGSAQLVALARDLRHEEARAPSGVEGLLACTDAMERAARDLRLAFGRAERRVAWDEVAAEPRVREARDVACDAVDAMLARLAVAAEAGEGFAQCERRAGTWRERARELDRSTPGDYVAWVDVGARAVGFHFTPLDVAATFRGQMEAYSRSGRAPKAWVFTSATLSVDGDFGYFKSRLGLEDADAEHFESPFDYARQALLYLPPDLPMPADARYTQRVVEAVVPVIEAVGGGAFLLFTSHRALREAHALLTGRLPFPLLVQGEAPRATLLERFRALGNAVLLGAASFWEGVDVRGPALSCVVIDKLPFASPDDPVVRARGASIEQSGLNPFMEYQVPEAVIALKQGAGRLIRDVDDCGVLVVCDPRLRERAYGKRFLASLPPMPLTRSLDEVRAFVKSGVRGR